MGRYADTISNTRFYYIYTCIPINTRVMILYINGVGGRVLAQCIFAPFLCIDNVQAKRWISSTSRTSRYINGISPVQWNGTETALGITACKNYPTPGFEPATSLSTVLPTYHYTIQTSDEISVLFTSSYSIRELCLL